jgi:hypothetical protein
MLRWMGIRSFDLYEAFGADGLFTTSCGVEIWRIIEEADWAFRCILIEIDLNWLTIHKRICRELEFSRSHILLAVIARRGRQ